MPKGKKKKQTKSKEPAPEPQVEEPSTDGEAESEPVLVDIAALSVWQLIPIFVNILERVAWQKMGLVVNPQTQEIEKDLQQARVAIDSVASLLEHLGDHVEPDTKTALEARLTDLKLNFASQA
ncbi:MAG: DUF1844 domain-containing protein [Candidatus Hermodarchaeia archaeon]